jgi:hypothetical protein
MTKGEELTRADSTMNKTAWDEPVFILCGRDVLAPEAAEKWADLAEGNGVPPAKVAAARAWARQAAAWQVARGSRLPD